MTANDTARVPKTFLVTGGAGFIGSHLVDSLVSAGHRVLALDNLSTGSMENITPLLHHPSFHFARASITDTVVLDRLCSEADVVVHLAAAVGVRLIVEHPVDTVETNVMGTDAVLKAALRYGCRIIIASTSEVYGKGASIPFCEEDDVLLGSTSKSRWSYAASKMVDEFLGFAYYQEYGLPVVAARFFNTIGPRQTGRYGMVVPSFVRQALRNEPLTVFGDGKQTRCFCDVRDVVRAVEGLVDCPEAPGLAVNIGTTEEVSILELAERTREIVGSKSDIVLIPYSEAYAPGFEDLRRRVPDIRRIKGMTGWEPTWRLNDAVRSVVDYEQSRLSALPLR